MRGAVLPPLFFILAYPMQKIFYPLMMLSLLLTACSGDPSSTASSENEQNYPKGHKIERKESRGSLTGDSGLFGMGGADQEEGKGGGVLGVNAFLWRATLDTLAFMPLASADPFGGTILTDWYEDPKTPGERYKVNAIILDKTLRADGVRITVFKQKMEGGTWRDQKVDNRLGRSLEDVILTRAKQLKISQMGR